MDPAPLKQVADWVGGYQRFWDESYERLDKYLEDLKKNSEQEGGSGMNTTIGKLTIEAPADQAVAIMTRTFNAPRDLVFKAHNSCRHVSQWWGPRRYSFASCDMDFVEGAPGASCSTNTDTNERYPFTGVFREIQAPERLTWTFIFDVAPFNEHAGVETMIFSEEDGQTTSPQPRRPPRSRCGTVSLQRDGRGPPRRTTVWTSTPPP